MKRAIKKKERMMGKKDKREEKRKEKRGTTNKQAKNPLSKKKEEARNVSEQRVKGWIHVIRVHDTTH